MESCVLALRVTPKSSQDAIVGWHGDALKIKVRAAPENGRANAAVIAVLAEALGVPKKSITIESGETSRQKRMHIQGLAQPVARARLDTLLSSQGLGEGMLRRR
jgi:uncharacterized protein (TIGR00251 family)